ncbi:hypothetical protein ADL26_20825, partial [Thermoactinomyces vulgaris]
QVDRGEPRRGVDVEGPEAVEPGREVGVLVVVVGDVDGADGALRERRAGDRGEREREQQQERGAHGGELVPPAARERAEALGGLRLGAGRGREGGGHGALTSV